MEGTLSGFPGRLSLYLRSHEGSQDPFLEAGRSTLISFVPSWNSGFQIVSCVPGAVLPHGAET